MSSRRRFFGVGVLLVVVAALGWFLTPAPVAAQTGTRYVNPTDPTCGGQAPCYTTIQAAVTAALPGDVILLQAGTYHEQIAITGKNNTTGASEADRIVIQADPGAPRESVVVTPPAAQCTNGEAFRFRQSKFITLRGFTITGATSRAVLLLGGTDNNQAIHLERLRIFGNGTPPCDGGITIAGGNPGTLIVNSLIYGNGRNGIATIDIAGGPHYLIGNTIHGNAWNGVNVTRSQEVFLVNNAITGNGTATGTIGGRFGVTRESTTPPNPGGIHLLNNLICGNRLGEINGPALDGTDSGNLTPTGTEGPGVTASPGCGNTATVYAHLVGTDGIPNTADDDFTLATGSPAIDHGMDPRTLGLPASFNPLFETDFTGVSGARPKNATGAPTAQFDMGALEKPVPDTQAPTVTFVQPATNNAYVRQTVTVQAQATDNGSGVASFGLSVDGQSLSATLTPPLPPPAASVTATGSFNTTTVPDGAHTLGATATDAAGNPATATRVVIVDNTPPDTFITGGPSGEINVATATFTFSGSDNLTSVGNLQFAWRLDGGAFTAFSAATTATFTGLTEGSHTFDVKALDLAGNEDPTPATRTFTVRFGPSITSVDPASGTIGTFVTITGTNFELSATTVTFNGLAAVVRTVTATQITTTVPMGAATGPLVVTTSRGTASRTFTVETTGDFTLTAAPAPPATAKVIAGDQTSVSIAAGGSGSFTSLVSLSVSTPPGGITAGFSPSNFVAPGASAFVNFALAGTVAPGTYSFTVTGQAQVDGRSVTRTAAFALEVLAPDTLAVTGRVLTAEAVPQPIPGVTVTLGSAFVLTDAAGNFVLRDPPAGANMLRVDGRSASPPDAQYPPVEVNIAVNTSGPTRVPFIVYLPKLDTAHPITLPTDPDDPTGTVTTTFQATTPTIPGLVVTIPAGTRIMGPGPDFNPVRQITITPVPIDRVPMPLPPGVTLPLVFSIQPGGAVPSQPLPITFPNAQQLPPGTRADLYFFDLSIGNWAIWGQGTVSDDSRVIVSDPGAGLPRFAWHGAACRSTCPILTAGGDRHATGGEPVDLVTGQFTVNKTDLVLPGRIPVTIQRSHRSGGTTLNSLLGVGWTVGLFDAVLTPSGTGFQLTKPDQSTYTFRPTGSGQWSVAGEPEFAGAVLTQLSGEFNFQIRFKDGTVHRYDRIIGFTNAAGLAAITDRNHNTVTITRATVFLPSGAPVFGRIVQITEPAGRSLSLNYNAQGLVQTVTDPINRVVQYGYDSQGRLSTVTDPAGGVTTYAYDTSNRIVSITDPRGITFITNTYDGNGRVVGQAQADGGVWSFAYTLEGNVVTQTTVADPRRNATTYRFNSQGFTLSTTDALGQTTTFDYAPGSNLLLATTDPLGRVTRFGYDTLGNVTSVTDPANHVRGFTYETTFNRVTSITNPVTPPTQFAYDADGNLTTITDPRGKPTTLTYNTVGQPLTITDPLGHTTTFTYDAQGNLATTADPLGNTTSFQYDLVSRLTRQTDPRGRATGFAYDPLNRVRAIADALGGVTGFTYDGNGNLLTVTDARANPPTTHSYDSMDRLATRTDPLGASESFIYDLAGNLTRRTDRKGQASTFAYDSLNRLTTSSYADGSGTSFAYDGVSRLVRVDDSTGGTLTNTYDALDRLLTQSTTLGTVSYAYDAIGRRTQLNVPGLSPTTYGYDDNSRLTQILRGMQTVGLDYDDAGRRTLLTLPSGVSTEYQYDVASHLTALIYRNAAGTLGNLTYQYDPAGSRTRVGGSFARTLLPTAIASASYDAANRQKGFGPSQMTFDPNGNLTTITDATQTTNLAWDARDRLVGLEQPGTVASFAYAFGRRLAKTVNGAATQFLYDGLDIAQQLEAQHTTSYLRSLAIDETLGLSNPDGTFFLTADALGSTVAVRDPSGSAVTEYTYDTFGAVSTTNPAFPNPFQFTGRENDGLAGLYYYRARYYHPGLARFVSEDPIGFAAGELNLYTYARANPLCARDPMGFQAVPIPAPFPVPIILPPTFIPGTPENKAAADSLRRGIDWLSDTVSNVLNRNAAVRELRRDALQKCINECLEELKKGGEWPFRRCIVDCMRREGHYP